MKYEIIKRSGEVLEVEGKPITFPGFEKQEFFVGKDFLPDIPEEKRCRKWRVCIAGSGALLGWGVTRKGAIEHAQTILIEESERWGKEEIAERFTSLEEETKRRREAYRDAIENEI